MKLTGQRRCVKITRMMYQRWWFLRLEEFRLLIARSVATIAAMKSGLKAHSQKCLVGSAATIAAMKSGLKETAFSESISSRGSSNHCRDEKRTESLNPSSNHCRDEKSD